MGSRFRDSGSPPRIATRGDGRAYLRAVFASFCSAIVFWQLSSTWGLHVIEVGGYTERTYGWLMAINGLLIVAFELPLTSLTRRFPEPRAMMVGYLLMGVGVGLSALGGAAARCISESASWRCKALSTRSRGSEQRDTSM